MIYHEEFGATVFSIEEFKDAVSQGCIIPGVDGSCYYGTAEKDLKSPASGFNIKRPAEATHIWYYEA